MITRKPAENRGVTQRGWLDSRHSFSFGDHYDPEEMGFRSLRVINEDWFGAGRGFPTHPHRDMEILTIVLEGSLEHKDSLGTGSVIRPGEIQKMTAGTGIAHSEANPDPANPVHLYQIWLLPDRAGLTPGYEQKTFPAEERRNRFQLVAGQRRRQRDNAEPGCGALPGRPGKRGNGNAFHGAGPPCLGTGAAGRG